MLLFFSFLQSGKFSHAVRNYCLDASTNMYSELAPYSV